MVPCFSLDLIPFRHILFAHHVCHRDQLHRILVEQKIDVLLVAGYFLLDVGGEQVQQLELIEFYFGA